jgi:DNA-directed RNA polymerase specialized sigma24 family protein
MAAASPLATLLERTTSLTGAERERAFDELMRLLMILVRARMDARLRSRRESVDVCQSVVKSFVQDFHAGKVAFENEAALAGYLQTVVKNKLADLARMDTALRRGGGRADAPMYDPVTGSDNAPPDDGAGVSTVVADAEARERMMATLSDEDRRLFDLRARGLEWDQIAQVTGETSAALRKRWSRMQQRLGDELGSG